MKQFKNVKSIGFEATYEGNGCVNFDSNEQKVFLIKNELLKFEDKTNMKNNNFCFAKKQFGVDEDGSINFLYKVSSECLRHEIFKDVIPFQNPNIVAVSNVLYNTISLPEFIMRGYCFTRNGKNGIKKKSALTITDAVEIREPRKSINFDFHSSCQEKSVKSDDKNEASSTAIYNIENVGNNVYAAKGFIDLTELQFVADDPTYDRIACGGIEDGSQEEKVYLNAISHNFPNMEDARFSYYYKNMVYTKDEWAERGILFSQEAVDLMVKNTIKGILKTNILRRGAYFYNTNLTLNIVTSDGFTESIDVNLDNIDDFFFGYSQEYFEASEEKILANKRIFDDYKKSIKN